MLRMSSEDERGSWIFDLTAGDSLSTLDIFDRPTVHLGLYAVLRAPLVYISTLKYRMAIWRKSFLAICCHNFVVVYISENSLKATQRKAHGSSLSSNDIVSEPQRGCL